MPVDVEAKRSGDSAANSIPVELKAKVLAAFTKSNQNEGLTGEEGIFDFDFLGALLDESFGRVC